MKIVSTKEAAKMLHISMSTLEKWRKDGKGPSYGKIGSKVFYCEETLKRWLTAQFRNRRVDAA